MTTAPVPTTPQSQNFPTKLYECIKELEREGLSHIAGFQPHGRCIVVRKQHEFVTQILPRWFNQTKYSSFQRQLNLYGFQRITSGPDKNGYFHPDFLQGKQSLVSHIKRTQVKGTGPRRPATTTTAPNFYLHPMPPQESHGLLVTSHQHSAPVAPFMVGAASLQFPNALALAHAVPSHTSAVASLMGGTSYLSSRSLVSDMVLDAMIRQQQEQQQQRELEQHFAVSHLSPSLQLAFARELALRSLRTGHSNSLHTSGLNPSNLHVPAVGPTLPGHVNPSLEEVIRAALHRGGM